MGLMKAQPARYISGGKSDSHTKVRQSSEPSSGTKIIRVLTDSVSPISTSSLSSTSLHLFPPSPIIRSEQLSPAEFVIEALNQTSPQSIEVWVK